MDQPPSYPHYQSPNPNFFHRAPPPLNSNPNFFHRPPPPPLQTPNTYSIPPSPPRIRELYGTLSSLQSLLSEFRCPFEPNHLMPPEALFLHSLRCPKPLDLTPLLGSFSSYKNTLELPIEPELNNGDGD
ncbi:hypothetical protein F2Q68_00018336 [Brassica cretica]|uniref:CHHC U11-48K-type domain-containing protein n=1 Tax=Brassica cretica TaxID=69181 RepID=A0A8S9HBF0_BRACR|nr:hypothetical protein F2Q68_00018336 [Brassica cretica]